MIFLTLYLGKCAQDMTIEERAEIPTCNLAEIVRNKWLQ